MKKQIRATHIRRPMTSVVKQLVTVVALVATSSAIADSGSRTPPPARYIEECASCHAPFPARMLPAASWQALMSSLDKHFGTDASVDPVTAKALSDWLNDNASRRTSVRPRDDRLTLGADFVRKHREVPAATWTRPSVRSASNCAACHTNSAHGRFSEHDVRIPK